MTQSLMWVTQPERDVNCGTMVRADIIYSPLKLSSEKPDCVHLRLNKAACQERSMKLLLTLIPLAKEAMGLPLLQVSYRLWALLGEL